jgi:hypothetical protein
MCGGSVPSRERSEGVEAEERMMLLVMDFIFCSVSSSWNDHVECCRGGGSNRGNGTIPVNVSQNSVIASRYRLPLILSGMPYGYI